MRKVLKIAWRDFLDTVQTKTFLLSFLMVPLIIGIIWFFAKNEEKAKKSAPARKVVITNLAEGLSPEIQPVFKKYGESDKGNKIDMKEVDANEGDFQAVSEQQKDLVRKGKLDLYVVLEKNIVSGRGKMFFYTRKIQVADMAMLDTVENLINQATVNLRCRQKNVPFELLQEIRRHVSTEQVSLDEISGKERREKVDFLSASLVPFFFMFLMFMGVFSQNQYILTSIIEEKNSRIIEVLLSAVNPVQLLAGKILALGGIGLTVMAIWTTSAIVASQWRGLALDISPQMVVFFILYYVFGFILITCIFASIGAICNTLKEAQGLLMPITFLLILPMVSWFTIAQNPEGLYARIMSFIPPVTPMVMVLRLSSTRSIPLAEVLATLVVLGACVPATIWAGAKIFRTGILLYGKRPQLREVLRWLRRS